VDTLRTYLAREIYGATLFVFAAFLGLFAFFDLINELTDLGRGQYRLQHALAFVALSIPSHVYELFPVAETLQMMRFAELEGGDLKLTPEGMAFANAELDERKKIFARHLLNYIPLAAHVRRVLDERTSHVARKSRFLDEIEDYMTDEAAEQTMRTIVSWGRYAEAFAYNDEGEKFSLENPGELET